MATLSDDLERTKAVRDHFEKLIADPALLGPDFQPIVRLADRSVEGWRAIGRVSGDADLADRESLVAAAVTLGLAERMDWAFRCRVFDVAAQAGVTEPVHVKVSLHAYGTVPPPRLAVAFGRARTLRVVNELQEGAFDSPSKLSTGLAEFAKWGWALSVPDLSGRPDASAILQKVKPSVAQVDLTTPGRSTSDALKRYVETAQRLGIELLAIGLNTPLRINEATILGVELGRGNALGAPAPLPA